MTEMSVEMVDVSDLIKHPENPRVGDINAIAASIKSNGWWGTIVAQKSTNYVLAGNHRLEAAIKLQMATVPVYWVDVDDQQAIKILLADNKTAELATYNEELLIDLLSSVVEESDLLGTGYSDADIAQLLDTLDIDFVPEEGEQPRLDQRNATTCPECGFEWRVGPRNTIEPV